jgi:hypothetical protein
MLHKNDSFHVFVVLWRDSVIADDVIVLRTIAGKGNADHGAKDSNAYG